MSQLDVRLREMDTWGGSALKERLAAELRYARRVSLVGDGAYDGLIEGAFDFARDAYIKSGAFTDSICYEAEKMLAPMQEACKAYRLLMVGHAHIDMNWMWRYDETVSITLDTFRTALNLMREFPDFTFSQSQASVYRIVEEFEPEMLSEIKQRIRAGQWEVSASTWVEADRNMPHLESVARHFLYTKRYLPKLLDIDTDSLNLDYEPDTFGHGEHVPEMLTRAGVKFYYHCRGEKTQVLYRWRSPSGAEVLVYREPFWYLGPIGYDMAEFVPEFCSEYGLNTAMRVYGVGDHGGGPTRRDIERIREMGDWPIFPKVEFGSYREFYEQADRVRENLPAVTGERNFVFDGCYTSQSRIKAGNFAAERLLIEAEAMSAFSALKTDHEYQVKTFEAAWRNVLFNQFHDIIPGSGVVDTREHAMGLYSQTYALANTRKRAALTALAERIDTESFVPSTREGSTAEGAGVGFGVYPYKLAQVERGGGRDTRIFHLFNPLSCERRTIAEVVLWDFKGDLDRVQIIDENGEVVRHQIVSCDFEPYWQHDYIKILIDARLPAMGYRTYGLRLTQDVPPKALYTGDIRLHEPFEPTLENEKILARFDPVTGALKSLHNKDTGAQLLSDQGAQFRVVTESADRGMTSWTIGRYMDVAKTGRTVIKRTLTGELRNALSFETTFGRSKLSYTVSLDSMSEALVYEGKCDWLEAGNPAEGIPQLQFAMEFKRHYGEFIYEVPAGIVRRAGRAMDAPSLGMIAVEDGVLNSVYLMAEGKYGFRGNGNEIGVTLLRSSFDPDPYPELNAHALRFAIGLSHAPDDAHRMRETQAFFHAPIVLSGSNHPGDLPLQTSFMRHKSGAGIIQSVKRAEDEDKLILRGCSPSKHAEEMVVEFDREVLSAERVDFLERPEAGEVRIAGRQIAFTVEACQVFSVKVEL